VILQHGVGEQPRAKRDGEKHEHDRLAVEPPQRPVHQQQPAGRDREQRENRGGQPRHGVVQQLGRRPAGERKAAAGKIELAADRDIDTRGELEQRRRAAGDDGIDGRRLEAGGAHCRRPMTSARSAAPARAVSSGIG
jgi:hypothetical protein